VNVRLYANTSTLALTERLEGGSFQPPLIPAYQDLQIRFKLAETVNSVPTIDKRSLYSLTARIGWPDEAPVSGSYQLEITLGGDTVTTADIAFDATTTAIALAINTALGVTIASLNPCTVSEYEGLKRIVFADKTEQPVIACVENALWPASFVEVDEIAHDEGYAYVLQLRQTPAAEVSTFSEQVPTAPTITEKQAGGEVDGFSYNEIQKLTLSPAFEGGSFRIVRGGVKTVPISVPTTIAAIRTAVAPLADTGGSFVVTETNDGVYIEFTGSMGAENQDLMTVEVFDSPGVDYFFHLPTKTDDMRTLMQQVDTAGQVRIPLSLQLQITDALAAGGRQDVTIQQDLVFIKPVPSSANNVAASLVWGQPLSKGDYLRHSTSSLLVGNRAARFLIGDGSATSFALQHNLVENAKTVTVNATTNVFTAAGHNYQDLDPITFSSTTTLPAGLTAGTVYFVRDATTDTFKVATSANGTAVDITDTGTGTHTARLRDGVAEGVAVEVWQTGGSQLRMAQSAYTVAKTSTDVVTISGFASTPTTNQYEVFVMTMGRPATYQAHTHAIAEITGLQAILDAQSAAIAALQAAAGNLGAVNSTSLTNGTLTRQLGSYFAMPGVLTLPEVPESLLGWDPYSLTDPLPARKLLGAVHLAAASVESLPSPLPAASSTYVGRVFTTASARTDFPGGGLLAGDHAACDGRVWYRVARNGSETTWYPQTYELELFRFAITEDDLVASSVLDLAFGLEAALFTSPTRPRTRRSGMRWSLRIQHGVQTEDSSPATTGSNLDTYFSAATDMLTYSIYLSEKPWNGRFGVKITRPASGSITAVGTKMFKSAAALAAPSTANFALRAILTRGDVEDSPLDPRGLIAVRGFDVGADGQADNTLGRYTIAS
jgi:hypothetical protein